MSNLSEGDKDRMFSILDAQSKQLQRLEQGMYGDEQLGQKGLIKDMHYVKSWITTYKIKIAFLTGASAAVGVLVKWLWDYFLAKISGGK